MGEGGTDERLPRRCRQPGWWIHGYWPGSSGELWQKTVHAAAGVFFPNSALHIGSAVSPARLRSAERPRNLRVQGPKIAPER